VDAYVAKRREVIEKYFGWNEWIEAMARYDARTLADGQVSKSFGREGSEAYMRGYFGYRFEDYYPRVTCPLLILTEEEAPDSQRERAALQAITRWAPQAQIEALPGWQHPYGWLLTPQIAGEAVLRFLGSLAA
jgi:2-succinyl-6-hydroxy-2,4-cyclohexadiene-1-carboxylate synthase